MLFAKNVCTKWCDIILTSHPIRERLGEWIKGAKANSHRERTIHEGVVHLASSEASLMVALRPGAEISVVEQYDGGPLVVVYRRMVKRKKEEGMFPLWTDADGEEKFRDFDRRDIPHWMRGYYKGTWHAVCEQKEAERLVERREKRRAGVAERRNVKRRNL